MALSLTNRDDIIASSYSVITDNGAVIDILNAAQSNFEEHAYSKTQVDNALGLKADQSTTYTKTQMNTFLDGKPDDADLDLKADKLTTYSKTQVDTALALKADQSTTYSKTQVDSAVGLKADQSTTYTKTQVDTNISAVVGAAPVLLNTLVELSAALNNDANYATTITNALAAKAPINNPTFTGTVSGINRVMVGLTSVDDTSDTQKPVSVLQLAALNLKANSADVYTKNTIKHIAQPKSQQC